MLRGTLEYESFDINSFLLDKELIVVGVEEKILFENGKPTDEIEAINVTIQIATDNSEIEEFGKEVQSPNLHETFVVKVSRPGATKEDYEKFISKSARELPPVVEIFDVEHARMSYKIGGTGKYKKLENKLYVEADVREEKSPNSNGGSNTSNKSAGFNGTKYVTKNNDVPS